MISLKDQMQLWYLGNQDGPYLNGHATVGSLTERLYLLVGCQHHSFDQEKLRSVVLRLLFKQDQSWACCPDSHRCWYLMNNDEMYGSPSGRATWKLMPRPHR